MIFKMLVNYLLYNDTNYVWYSFFAVVLDSMLFHSCFGLMVYYLEYDQKLKPLTHLTESEQSRLPSLSMNPGIPRYYRLEKNSIVKKPRLSGITKHGCT